MGTLWNKGVSATQIVEDFTVGNDRVLDLRLAKYDVIGSKAHIAMLAQIGLLAKEEEKVLQKGLDEILLEIENGDFKEIIIATNPTEEGDTTALYIKRILEGKDLTITRLASGLPIGGDLGYADKTTLMRSLKSRIKI